MLFESLCLVRDVKPLVEHMSNVLPLARKYDLSS